MKSLVVGGLMALFSFHVAATECQKDLKEYCQGVEPGKGQLMKCLSDNEADLSGACKTELKAFKAKTTKANPCFEDLAENCSDIPKGSAILCLLKNETRLSDSCKADVAKKKDKFFAKEVCAQDLLDKCYGELSKEDGIGLANRCLIKNKGKLNARCEVTIASRIQKMRAKIPCFDDAEKFCPGTVNRGEIDACLEKKLPQLDKKCQGYVKREQGIAKKDPCYPHIKTFCRPGLSRAQHMECLDQHESDISNACKQKRQVQKDKVQKLAETCEADRVKYCGKEPHAKGMILKCLKKNKAKVTKSCAALL